VRPQHLRSSPIRALFPLVLCTPLACGEAHPPARILLVSMDTVRADRVGAEPTLTPHLDAIAAEGVAFSRFYAASNYTIPSTMSIFTGLDPAEHGVVDKSDRLSDGRDTLAAKLSRAGYHTVGFHEGGFVSGRYGFARGFDAYQRRPTGQLVREGLDEVLAWIRAHRDERWFLFLQTYAAHYPYGGYRRYRREAPERGLLDGARIVELRRRYPFGQEGRRAARRELDDETRELCTLYNQLAESYGGRLGCGENKLDDDFPQSQHAARDLQAIQRSYDERVRRVDRALGTIRATLEDLGQWDDTLLVVTSDHGEAFFEHGLYRHAYVPFDEVLRVPLVVSYPRRLCEGGVRRIEAPAWHLDLAPTILRIAGLEPPPALRGLDLGPALSGRATLPGDRLLAPAVYDARGIELPRRVALREDLKFIEGNALFGDGEGLLFDLRADAGERANLREARGGDAAELERRARDWEASLESRPQAPMAAPELTSEEEAELRALGYLP
jgi:arylsulfatase A-like enzyme